jgi:hypothetical protein
MIRWVGKGAHLRAVPTATRYSVRVGTRIAADAATRFAHPDRD